MTAPRREVKALTAFMADHDGKPVNVAEGVRYPAAHPLVKAHPTLFEPVVVKRGRPPKKK